MVLFVELGCLFSFIYIANLQKLNLTLFRCTVCLYISKFTGITAGENVNVEAPEKLSVLVFMTAFLMKILADLCPCEKWGVNSCSLVLHWHWPVFVLPRPVCTKDRASVIMLEEISTVSELLCNQVGLSRECSVKRRTRC